MTRRCCCCPDRPSPKDDTRKGILSLGTAAKPVQTCRFRSRGAKVTLKARAFSYLGAFSAGCVLLAGCTPADGTISPPPPATSAPASATPPETAQQREERLAYEAAEKAYRTFRAEYNRLYRSEGGSAEPTIVMKDNAAGTYLRSMLAFLKHKVDHERHSDRGVRIAYVRQGGFSPQELVLL